MKFCLAFIFTLIALPCLAGSAQNLGTFGDWTAYTYGEGSEKICYISSQPTKSSGKYSKRDDVFLMITHRPQEKAFNVVNVIAGYTYQKGSKPTLAIDKKKSVALQYYEDTAWATDSKTDKLLVEQMKAGSTGVLSGKSKRGTLTTDTFSFKGFSKAYNKISEACNYK